MWAHGPLIPCMGPIPPLLLSRWLGFVSVDLYTYSPIFLPIGLSYLSIYLSIYIHIYLQL